MVCNLLEFYMIYGTFYDVGGFMLGMNVKELMEFVNAKYMF